MSVAQPPARNSPCPCGSGRRYKDCHGTLDGRRVDGQAAIAGRSSYRAPNTEWGALSEIERDACGALMERALAHQLAGRLAEAAVDYAEVVSRAPLTHDALHMLGVIAFTRKDLDEAERLITAAIALRRPYPAITHNLQLVEDARLASRRAQIEELCERALAILADLALAPAPLPPTGRLARAGHVHLIGRVKAPREDDGWTLARLAKILESSGPSVWATDSRTPQGRKAAKPISADLGIAPSGGTHVFVGVNFDDVSWLERADAERVIVLCFGAPPSLFLDRLRDISRDGKRRVELAFTSAAVAARFGSTHSVLPPPFEPPPKIERSGGPSTFAAGIVGQMGAVVEDASDVDFLREIARCAGRLHVYHPGRLRYSLGRDARVLSFPRCDGGLEVFVSALSCYVQRKTHWWRESMERGLFAAMAAGVPLICPTTSIYAEYIDHDVDGWLYGSTDEALALIERLQRDGARSAIIGAAARDKATRLFDGDALARRYEEFFFGNASWSAKSRTAYEPHAAIQR